MGSNSTSSNSTPLSAEQRQGIYRTAMSELGGSLFDTGYKSPGYTDSGPARSLSDGDYNRFEQRVLDSRLAPLKQYEMQAREQADADLNKRGLFKSGIGVRTQNDITDKFADNYQQAGADAATQRYAMEQQDLNAMNQYGLARSAAANQFYSTEADRQYQAKWRPADYLAGVWNGTGGVVSSSSGGGWSI